PLGQQVGDAAGDRVPGRAGGALAGVAEAAQHAGRRRPPVGLDRGEHRGLGGVLVPSGAGVQGSLVRQGGDAGFAGRIPGVGVVEPGHQPATGAAVESPSAGTTVPVWLSVALAIRWTVSRAMTMAPPMTNTVGERASRLMPATTPTAMMVACLRPVSMCLLPALDARAP